MRVANKALWLIESRMREPLALNALAAELGVSDFHLARAFASTVGMSLMQYVRRRRLTEAAHQLVRTDMSIIDVAVDAEYNSQEAFARAFKAEFGLTPQAFRNKPEHKTAYLEAATMESTNSVTLNPPRIVSLPALRVLGLARRYNPTNSANIPDQWAQFNQLGLEIGPDGTLGVCYNADAEGNMDYLCGIEVSSFDAAREHLDRLTLPAQTYAVFQHGGHVSEIRDIWQAIWNHGLADAGLVVSEGPEFEKYGSDFDPETGNGGFEIWIPVTQN